MSEGEPIVVVIHFADDHSCKILTKIIAAHCVPIRINIYYRCTFHFRTDQLLIFSSKTIVEIFLQSRVFLVKFVVWSSGRTVRYFYIQLFFDPYQFSGISGITPARRRTRNNIMFELILVTLCGAYSTSSLPLITYSLR